MNEEDILETGSVEKRISQMKAQFQRSYDVFIKANEELSKISIESLDLTSAGSSQFAGLNSDEINEIVDAGSVDDSLSKLRLKIEPDIDETDTFPDISRLLNIMSSLQSDIDSMTENQKQFARLSEDVNQEMNLFEKRMEDSMNQLNELVVESVDVSSDECSEVEHEKEEESFGSETLSD